MSSDFDPYYLWLGIPPHEQPPNHYRLLGIAAFESNASVIDAAASRQSTYLHSVATGPQRQASQKLLTEIAAARRTLLNAESKHVYDAELKSRIESASPKAAAPPVARPVAVPIAVAVPVATAAPVAAPVAAAVPVAAPVVPVAAPIVPVAVPVVAFAAPVAVPVAAPIAAPVIDTAMPPVEQSPLSDLFGSLDAAAPPEFESPTLDTPVTTASPPTPPVASSKPSQTSNRKSLMVGGGAVVVLILILGFVFRPRGNDSSSESRAPKSSTSKKKSSAAAKPKPEPDQDATPEVVATPTKGPRLIRFIRIELPRKGVLTLAEVEAWYDNRNVASYGFPEQKSTDGAAAAKLAVDGNPAGNSAAKSQSSTTESDQPWWQLDLGGAYPLEKIVIHNRTDAGMSERLKGFTLLLMDDKRRPLVELKDQPAPAPRSEFIVSTLPAAPPMTRGPAKSKPKSPAK